METTGAVPHRQRAAARPHIGPALGNAAGIAPRLPACLVAGKICLALSQAQRAIPPPAAGDEWKDAANRDRLRAAVVEGEIHADVAVLVVQANRPLAVERLYGDGERAAQQQPSAKIVLEGLRLARHRAAEAHADGAGPSRATRRGKLDERSAGAARPFLHPAPPHPPPP